MIVSGNNAFAIDVTVESKNFSGIQFVLLYIIYLLSISLFIILKKEKKKDLSQDNTRLKQPLNSVEVSAAHFCYLSYIVETRESDITFFLVSF
jgi:hypothetical protein